MQRSCDIMGTLCLGGVVFTIIRDQEVRSIFCVEARSSFSRSGDTWTLVQGFALLIHVMRCHKVCW